mmetsp:Transcript_65565/g.165217  ORF Transcript_65565/g.165217 Transcript_65565/m.165217 type:complete len:201 (+) Transcript_65565:426-1028(+)
MVAVALTQKLPRAAAAGRSPPLQPQPAAGCCLPQRALLALREVPARRSTAETGQQPQAVAAREHSLVPRPRRDCELRVQRRWRAAWVPFCRQSSNHQHRHRSSPPLPPPLPPKTSVPWEPPAPVPLTHGCGAMAWSCFLQKPPPKPRNLSRRRCRRNPPSAAAEGVSLPQPQLAEPRRRIRHPTRHRQCPPNTASGLGLR